VIDLERLRLHAPEFAYDLPAGSRRPLRRADGYPDTFVAYTEIRAGHESTGARRVTSSEARRHSSTARDRPPEASRPAFAELADAWTEEWFNRHGLCRLRTFGLKGR
jgi:hypothetical protein